jgi:arabinofuranosyltransferase
VGGRCLGFGNQGFHHEDPLTFALLNGKSAGCAMKRFLQRYYAFIIAAAVLVPHVRLFDFVTDDAYISFRYARNLALHGQLVFNLGERVEGYTNFLWTVVLALGIKLGLGPVVLSRFLGVALGIGTLAVVVRMSLRLADEQRSRWHLVAPLLLASMGAYACWCTGGLETQLFTFLITLAFDRVLGEVTVGKGCASAVAFAFAAMTRPEGVLFFGLVVLFRVLTNLRREHRLLPQKHEFAWAGLFLALFGPYFVWRWHYYSWPFPNTFYVKSSGATGTWKLGTFYLRRFSEDYGVHFLILLALVGRAAKHDDRRRDLRLLAGLVCVAFAAYVVKVGGDFMGLYRFILPVVPLGAAVLAESTRRLYTQLRLRLGTWIPAIAFFMIGAGYVAGSMHTNRQALTHIGADNGIDTPAYLKKYAEERIPPGQWLGKYRRPDDIMSVGGAGVIPYYSEIPSYDVFGLVDATIAHDPRMTVSNRPGHQKWGSDEYILSRKPTLMTHRYCLGSSCPVDNGWIPPGYEWVRATTTGYGKGTSYYSFLKRRDRAFGPFPAMP